MLFGISWWAILKPWCYCPSSRESLNSWSIFELILTLHCSSIPCVFSSCDDVHGLKRVKILKYFFSTDPDSTQSCTPCWCPGDEKITWALELSTNTCLFISLCTLRDLPQEKNPKPLCLGKIFLFFYILTFLYKESMCGDSCASGWVLVLFWNRLGLVPSGGPPPGECTHTGEPQGVPEPQESPLVQEPPLQQKEGGWGTNQGMGDGREDGWVQDKWK